MDIQCEIIWDLLPLYIDDVCREESRLMVEEHLKHCEKCQAYYASLQDSCKGILAKESERISPQREEYQKLEKNELKKSVRRYKKRIWIPFVAVVLTFPILACAIFLGVNEIRKEGLCYSNLIEVHNAMQFAKALQKENLNYVVTHLDYKGEYDSVLEAYESVDVDSLYHEIRIEGEEYVVFNSSCFGQLLIDEEYTWEEIVDYGIDGAIFPKEEYSLLSEYFSGESDVFSKITIAGTECYTFSGDYAHGDLYVKVENFQEDYSSEIMPYYVPVFANLFPKEYFEEYIKWREKDWEETKTFLEENYADVFSMTWEEYSQQRREQVAAELEKLFAQGYRIESIRFSDAIYYGDNWGILISFEIKFLQGKDCITVDIRKQEDGYNITGWSVPASHTTMDALFEAM